MSELSRLPRAVKETVATAIHGRLVERQAKGPAEPELDKYIDEVSGIATTLGAHVSGHTEADASRVALLDELDANDDNVDRWLRHIEGFVANESIRRRGSNAPSAGLLHGLAFPAGRGPIDDHVMDENEYCRSAITVLKAPEHAATLAAIEMPADWVAKFEAAVTASQTSYDKLIGARGDKSAHIDLGRDAEITFVDVMTRLRRYIGSRAKRGETAKELEGKKLLEPLTTAIQKMKTEAAARATKADKKPAQAPNAPPEPTGDKPA